MNVTNEAKNLLIDYSETNRKNIDYIFKKDSSNLWVDKRKSIVTFEMSELVMTSKDGFPCSNV